MAPAMVAVWVLQYPPTLEHRAGVLGEERGELVASVLSADFYGDMEAATVPGGVPNLILRNEVDRCSGVDLEEATAWLEAQHQRLLRQGWIDIPLPGESA